MFEVYDLFRHKSGSGCRGLKLKFRLINEEGSHCVEETKINCAVTAQISHCAAGMFFFVFLYAENRFFHDAVQFSRVMIENHVSGLFD